MQRVLLVRLSALGDIIHSLPVIADIQRRWPNTIIDIAVDERFIEIPQLNCFVNKTISLPLKRVKKGVFHKGSWSALPAALKELRAEHYDVVIDLHGMIKSAAVALLSRAKLRVGFDVSQCSEKPAALCYHKHFLPQTIPNRVDWLRHLTSFAVDSDCSRTLDYGLPLRLAPTNTLRSIVFFHSSSDDAKNWHEDNWVALGKELIARGYQIELPWGNAREQERAHRLQHQMGAEHADVAPFRSLSEWVQHFSELALVIGLDTGLTHLAAAVGVPCVGVFTVTNPKLLVPQKPDYATTLGGNGDTPMVQDVLGACNLLLEDKDTIQELSKQELIT